MTFKQVIIFAILCGVVFWGGVNSEGEDKTVFVSGNDNEDITNAGSSTVVLEKEHTVEIDAVEKDPPDSDESPKVFNTEEEISNIRKEIGEINSEKSNVVRLETIDDVKHMDNSSLHYESTQKLEVTDTTGTLPVLNSTINETSNINVTSKAFPKRVKCLPRNKPITLVNNDGGNQSSDISGDALDVVNEAEEGDKDNMDAYIDIEPVVEVINGSTFLNVMSERHNPNITNRSTPAECSLVIFYAPWCPFSAMAAPNFNGLARLFPDISMYAVDSSKHQGINTQFGILALPTLIMFHNTKPISKFNQSNYMLGNFSEFINTFTGLEPSLPVELMDQDMEGPMPTKAVPEPDYYLYLAWLFTITCALGYFGKSSYCEWIIESFRSNWREAEIQHEHID